jgi:hypothetical protein
MENSMTDFNEIVEKLTKGCSEDEFKAMRCPICAEPLLLKVHPTRRAMSVRCHKSVHMQKHIKMDVSPEWQGTYVSDIWW